MKQKQKDEEQVTMDGKKEYIPPVLVVQTVELEYGIAAGSGAVMVPVDPNGNATGTPTLWEGEESETINGNL